MGNGEVRPNRLKQLGLAMLIVIGGTGLSVGSAYAAQAVGVWMGAH